MGARPQKTPTLAASATWEMLPALPLLQRDAQINGCTFGKAPDSRRQRPGEIDRRIAVGNTRIAVQAKKSAPAVSDGQGTSNRQIIASQSHH
jgi:hypothetical protein